MRLHATLGRFRLVVWWGKVEPVIGVTSACEDGRHILMWDFDNKPYHKVYDALREVQSREELPDVYVCESSPGCYIAFCFRKLRFYEAVRIVASTKGVDECFLTLSVRRGYFTLRLGPKGTKLVPLPKAVLRSNRPSDAGVDDLKAFVLYESIAKGGGRA